MLQRLCSSAELSLSATLLSGQCFRWEAVEPSSIGSGEGKKELSGEPVGECFRGVVGGRVVLLVDNTTDILFHEHSHSHTSKESTENTRRMLVDYFRLDLDLPAMQRLWTLQRQPSVEEKAAKKKRKASAMDCSGASPLQMRLLELMDGQERLRRLRLIRQPPRETLFSYICSQNSNVLPAFISASPRA